MIVGVLGEYYTRPLESSLLFLSLPAVLLYMIRIFLLASARFVRAPRGRWILGY
jgi:hypothetical protein